MFPGIKKQENAVTYSVQQDSKIKIACGGGGGGGGGGP